MTVYADAIYASGTEPPRVALSDAYRYEPEKSFVEKIMMLRNVIDAWIQERDDEGIYFRHPNPLVACSCTRGGECGEMLMPCYPVVPEGALFGRVSLRDIICAHLCAAGCVGCRTEAADCECTFESLARGDCSGNPKCLVLSQQA